MCENPRKTPDVSIQFDRNEPRSAGYYLKSLRHMFSEIARNATPEQHERVKNLCVSIIEANHHGLTQYDNRAQKRMQEHTENAEKFKKEYERIIAYAQKAPGTHTEKELRAKKSLCTETRWRLKKTVAKLKKQKVQIEEATIQRLEDHKKDVAKIEEEHNDQMKKLIMEIADLKFEFVAK